MYMCTYISNYVGIKMFVFRKKQTNHLGHDLEIPGKKYKDA